jgi:hypothetical protein
LKCSPSGVSQVDTITDNDAKPEEEGAVSLEIAQQVRVAIANLLGVKVPISPPLEGLPIELWLKRIVPVAVAAELMGGLTSETVLKKYRDKLIPLDGRKFGMRLGDALRLENTRRRLPRRAHGAPKDGGAAATISEYDSKSAPEIPK